MTSQPLLSICVPTYNRRDLLQRNIDFHLERFGALGISFEIVVANDCSTDGTADYLASIADPRVRAFTRARNSGFLDNYAFVMRRAQGKYAVFLGDDDLLIPEKVLAYIARMEDEPLIGMVQAPWLLIDERPGGGEIGPFYRIPGEFRFARGDLPRLMGFVLGYHIFPEFMIVRHDVLARAISSPCPFIFWAFLYTGRALAQADILFLPEPFARVTGVSADPRLQQGNNETMFQWDRYRGGVEYLVSLARIVAGDSLPEQSVLNEHIDQFMTTRMQVALKLNVGAKNWAEAYIMHHRMAAYGRSPLQPAAVTNMCRAAGIATAVQEAISYGPGPAILDPSFDESIFDVLKPEAVARTTRTLPAVDPDVPRAYVRINPSFPKTIGPKDAVFDVSEYIAQFV
ncbi:glycosyltransferase family 2 protein [Oryzibacter oryziterrae]|uniref:glycosyltransferase family 2 protein n=1 Tax=Oryzibacter oryziterrae TaxID=2766474 RepID=UPI001F44F6C5|nr:glycosyltransferase family 2 protein [Oryzibacter oryziterrae]